MQTSDRHNVRDAQAVATPFGNLARFNTCRLILDAVGEEALAHIAGHFLNLLGTTAVVFERNGDYALDIFASGWCRFLDQASFRACGTEDPREALASGRWLCRESCRSHAAQAAVEGDAPVDVACHGGLRIYAEPIRANGEAVGAVAFGYGNLTQEPAFYEAIAGRYGMPVEELRRIAATHPVHSEQTIDMAKQRLGFAARLIGAIVERFQAEDALRESEQQFQLFMRNFPGLTYIKDDEGRILFVNEGFSQYLGLKPEDVVGKTNADVFPADFAAQISAADQQVLESGENQTLEEQFAGRTWSTYKFVIPRQDGHPFLGGFTLDITEQKHAEAERQRLEEQMRHVQKLESLGVLAGGIAHDFNNLLTVILGNADLALTGLSPVHSAYANIQEIEMTSRRAAELCRQMLAYSGKGRFVVEKIDLSEVVQEMGRILQVSISKKAMLRYLLAPNLPPIEADASQVRQVAMNLITNASDALDDREGVIAISTGLADCTQDDLRSSYLDENLPAGRYVYMEVADTGCGMDRETQERMFDPFFTTKFTGRGLGLAAVLGIVRGHRGAIKISSQPGQGTTFRVLFPAATGKARAVAAAETAASSWHGSGAVLLADDEPTVRWVAQQMLEALGFTVLTAADGEEALEVYRAHAPEIVCVLLDLTMPRMGGEEALCELQQLCPDVRVIVSSGYSEQDIAQRFAGRKLAGFIQKPYTVQMLRETMQQAMGE